MASASAMIRLAFWTCRFSTNLPSTRTRPLPAAITSACAAMIRRDHSILEIDNQAVGGKASGFLGVR